VGCVRDELGDAEDHVARPGVLKDLAVQTLLDAYVANALELVARHEPRAHGTERVEPLAAEPLPVGELGLARAHIVCTREACDELEGIVDRDVVRVSADHDRELCLGVDMPDVRREQNRVPVLDECVRKLREQQRRLR